MRSPAKTFFETILVIAVVIAFVFVPLAAEACEKCGHTPPPFSDFDADADGFVSEEEFNNTRAAHMAAMAKEGRPMKGAASAPAFADLDGDGDGQLSEDELTAGQKAHMNQMHGMHKGEGKMQHMHMQKAKMKAKAMEMPSFGDIDTDGDGCISPEEFAAHQVQHHGVSHE